MTNIEKPLLSVVIVAYKSREEISACLESLPRTLAEHPAQIVVVDNSPGDGTGEIVQSQFPWVNYIAPEKNLGFGRANNLGYAAIHPASEFVLFLNPDTVCNEAALMTCLARLRTDRSIGLISPKLVLANGSMDLACRRSIPTLWDGFCRAVGLAAAFPRSAWFSGYNLTHLPEDGTYDVGAINGAFMMGRREVFDTVALKAEGLRWQANRIVADSGSKPPADGLPHVASFNDLSDGLLGRSVPPPASSLPRNASGPSPKASSLPPTATRSAPVFDETFFMYGDDLDLCIRVAKAGWRIVYDGSVSITHLKGVSVAKDYDLMSRAIFDANREVYLKHFNPRSSRFVRWKYTFAFEIWKRVAGLRAALRGHRRVRPL
jgi:GT2 family glycosyltransferase